MLKQHLKIAVGAVQEFAQEFTICMKEGHIGNKPLTLEQNKRFEF